MPPNFVNDSRLKFHYHWAKANGGTSQGVNSPATTQIYDLTNNGNNGALQNFAYTTSSGWTTDGLKFDGTDDKVQVASSGIGLCDNQEFTIEVWAAIVNTSSLRALFAYDYTSAVSPYYGSHLRVGSTGVFLGWNNSGTYSSESQLSGSLTGYDLTQIHQYVATWKSGEQKIYIDGLQKFASARSHTITYYNSPVLIGYSAVGGKLLGTIPIVRYYSGTGGTLSASEVSQNFAAGVTWTDDTLIANITCDCLRKVAKSLNVTDDTMRRAYVVGTILTDSKRQVSKSGIWLPDTVRQVSKSATIPADTVRHATVTATANADSKRQVSKSITAIADTMRNVVTSAVTVVPLDTLRRVIKTVSVSADTKRSTSKTVAVAVDTLRQVVNFIAVIVPLDTLRRVVKTTTVTVDTRRRVSKSVSVLVDTLRRIKSFVTGNGPLNCKVFVITRAIKTSVKTRQTKIEVKTRITKTEVID